MAKNQYRRLERTTGYSVLEITTPTDELYFWTDDPIKQNQILQQSKEADVTYLPVKQGGQIIGLIKRVELAVGETIPLTADWLIAADTPILHLIELFAEKPDRIFLVLQSSKIIGLVAPADLNKVPARASIYLLTAQFEDALAHVVRAELNENEAELEMLLSESRIQTLRAEHAQTQKGDLTLSLFYHLYLADLFTIVAKHQGLRKRLGLRSRNHADSELDFADLRNRVSHLTGLLLTSRDDLQTINDVCSKIIRLSDMMNNPNV